MTTTPTPTPTITSGKEPTLDKIWFTRCPVPTASGLAHHLGWLAQEFEPDGIGVGVLQDAPPHIAARHFDHELPGLFREGGNVPALAARSEGARTRLIGLTWIEESQALVAGPDSSVRGAAELRGARIGVPAWASSRARSFPRAMALAGIAGALRIAGLGWDDITLVEVATDLEPSVGPDSAPEAGRPVWPGFSELQVGLVDLIYIKGARSADHASTIGAVVAVDLDAHADPRARVNNGTPRPITVHEQLLEERPDVVERFLTRTLQAARWATTHHQDVRDVLAAETRSQATGVDLAYGTDFHLNLAHDLSAERLTLLERQKNFLLLHGFLARDFDLNAWVAHEPLRAAAAHVANAGATS